MLRPLLLIIGVGKTKVKVMKKYIERKTELLGEGWRAHPYGCVCSAIALTTGRTFDEAVELATKELNYDSKSGVMSDMLYNWLDNSPEWEMVGVQEYLNEYKVGGQVVLRRPRAASIAKKLSRGKYMLITRGHATAVIEGELIEYKPKRIVNSVYKYVG